MVSSKLLELMERVKAYGRDIYWPWFEEDVLKPILSVRPDETPTPDRAEDGL